MLESFLNKAAGLKTSLKRAFNTIAFLWHLQKFLEHLFKEFQWLLLRFQFMFSKEFRAKAGITVINKYQIQLICYRDNPEPTTVSVLQKKACKGQHKSFPVNVAKFLRIPILKNICEQLILKISTSAANLRKGGNS